MANRTSPLLPTTERRLRELGERFRLARLRRKLTAASVAERAGMSPMTLRGVERGEFGVTIGAYAAVLQVLGLDQDLDKVGADDVLGRELQDTRLRPRHRAGSVQQTGHVHDRLATSDPSQARATGNASSGGAGAGVSAQDLAALIKHPAPAKRRQ